MTRAERRDRPSWHTEEARARYREIGRWGDDVLADAVQRNADERPDDLCVADGRRRLSFAEARDASDRLAGALHALGVRPGDRVVAQLPNWWEGVVLYYAVARLGAVFVPRMTFYRESEMRDAAERTGATVLVTANRFRGFDHAAMAMKLRDSIESLEHVIVVGQAPEDALCFEDLLTAEPFVGALPDADDLHLIIFTSGTTAAPKGVMHTHNTILASTRAMAEVMDMQAGERAFVPSPLMHGTGLNSGLAAPTLAGAGAVLLDVWDVERALAMIADYRCNFSCGATPFVTMMLDAFDPQRHDLSSMRLYCCGGAPIPPAVVREARRRLGFEMIVGFGLSECLTVAVTPRGDTAEHVATTAGRAFPGNEVRLVDAFGEPVPVGVEGEICCSGPGVMIGYFDDPQQTSETVDGAGRCRTGDLGRADTDGYLTVTGRAKDIIIRGGNNITAAEIENLLVEHPGVRAASVIGVPDRRLGEKMCAMIVAAGAPPMLSDLVAFLQAHGLARYKMPEYLHLLDALPTNATGKVEKFRLRELAAAAGIGDRSAVQPT